MKSQKFETIEVAVRLRPLNKLEDQVRDEVAWDIKQTDSQLTHLPLKLRGSRFNDTRRSFEILAEGQGRVLQLKNKHRFTNSSNTQRKNFNGNESQRKTKIASNRQQLHARSKSSVSYSQQFNSKLRVQDSFSIEKINLRDSLNLHQRNVSCGPLQGNAEANPYGSPRICTQRDNISSEGGNKCGMFESRLDFLNRDNLDRVDSHGDFESSRGWNNHQTEKHYFKDPNHTSVISSENKPNPFVSRLPSIKKSNIPTIRASLTARKQTARNSKSVQGFCTAKKVKPFNEGLLNLSQRSKSSFRGHTAIKKKKDDEQSKSYENNIAQKQHKYNFDLIYGEKDTNRDVYEQTVRKVVLASIDGLNGTVFVYGQTGTGKTYTMMGNQRTASIIGPSVKSSLRESQISISGNLYDAYENSGVLIFSMQDLFDKINQMENSEHGQKNEKSFQIKLSYIEIYHEQIYDLLEHDKQRIGDNPLQIHEGKQKEFIVKGANEILVNSIHEVLQLIQYGERNRHYAETFLNHCSSRSHTLFRLKLIQSIKQPNRGYLQTTSYLNFVDLAGSEKISNYSGKAQIQNQRENESKSLRVKEGLSINKSLFYLTQVIHILSQRRSTHIPYRNSTLTKILKSSLSGNSRTSIIVCITPASSQIEQTVNSLKFGQEAMRVQQSAKVQMCELKNNGLRKRNLQFNLKGGVQEKVVNELIAEYEQKIEKLQGQLADNTQMKMLQDQNEQLVQERDRLIKALSQTNDRSFITRFLYTKQKQGTSILTLRHAGDIQILSQDQVELTMEQLLEERDKKLQELQLMENSCRQTVNQLSQDNKLLINENDELKEECDRLEAAYTDIITQFTKMSNIQEEILKMTNNERPDPYNETVNAAILTDRELKRVENGLQQQIFKIKEEKHKRNRQRKYSDSLSRNSSDPQKSKILAKINSVSATNQKQNHSVDSLLYVSQRSSAPKQMLDAPQPESNGQNIQIQKFMISSKTQNTDEFEGKQFVSQDLGSFNSADILPNNEGSSGSFGVKYPITFNQEQVKIPTLNIGGIQIDKSLYAQNEQTDYRSISNKVRESVQKTERLKSSRRSVDEFEQCSDIQLRSYSKNQESNLFQNQIQAVHQIDPTNQNLMHINFQISQCLDLDKRTQGSLMNSQTLYQPINVLSNSQVLEEKVINNMDQSKVDVFDQSNTEAFQNDSQQCNHVQRVENDLTPEQQQIWFGPSNAISHQFQMWNQPQFDIIKEDVQKENNPSSYDNMSNSIGFDLSTPGLQAGKGNFLGYNCSISGGRVSVYGSAMNSREQSQNLQKDIESQIEVQFPPIQRELSDIDVPMARVPQQMDPEERPQSFKDTFEKKSHGKSAIDNSLTSLSIEQQNQNSQTNEDILTHEDLGMNEELFIEFMLEQELNRYHDNDDYVKDRQSKFSMQNLRKNQEQKANNTVKNSKPMHHSNKSRVVSKDKQVKKSSRILQEHYQKQPQENSQNPSQKVQKSPNISQNKSMTKSDTIRNTTQLQNYNKNILNKKRLSTSKEQKKPQFVPRKQTASTFNQKQQSLSLQKKVNSSKSIPLSKNSSKDTSRENSIKKSRFQHQRQNSASGLSNSQSGQNSGHFQFCKNPSSINLGQRQEQCTVLQTSTSNSNRIMYDINSQSWFSKPSGFLPQHQASITPDENENCVDIISTPVLSPNKMDQKKNSFPPPNSMQKSEDIEYEVRDNQSIKTIINMEPSDSSCNVSKNGIRKRKTVNVSLDLRSDGECESQSCRRKTPQTQGNQKKYYINAHGGQNLYGNNLECSSVTTPYGLIEICDDNLSDNTILNSQSASIKTYQQSHQQKKFKQYLKLQKEFRCKTPSNIVCCEDNKEFFSVDKEFMTGVFNGGINQEEPNFVNNQENRSAISGANIPDQNFQADLQKVKQPISHNISQVDEISQKHQKCVRSRKKSLPKIQNNNNFITSGYNSNTISQSHSVSNLNSVSQNQSNNRSFQPTLSKENKKLEKVNRKLQRHQDQYKQLYLEFYNEKTEFDGNDEMLQEFVHDNIQVQQPSYEVLGYCVNQSPNDKEIRNERQNNSCYVESVKLCERAKNTSIISNQTTQGCATSQTLATRRSIDKNSNSIKNNFSNKVRNSGEFDIKSRLSRLKKTDLKSQRSQSKSALSSRSNGSVQISNKLKSIKSQKQTNLVSQALLNPSEKRTELQREYQQIREKRKSIIDSLNLQNPDKMPLDIESTNFNNRETMNKTKKSPSVFLRDISPKIKTREFQPVIRHKEFNSLARNVKTSSALSKR